MRTTRNGRHIYRSLNFQNRFAMKDHDWLDAWRKFTVQLTRLFQPGKKIPGRKAAGYWLQTLVVDG